MKHLLCWTLFKPSFIETFEKHYLYWYVKEYKR